MNVKKTSSTIYVGIVDGEFRVNVKEGTPDSKTRLYEKLDGTTGTKTELSLWNVIGHIQKVNVVKKKMGEKEVTQLEIYVKGDEDYLVQMPLNTNYSIDFLKKMPGIDFNKEVKLSPYKFIPEGKTKPLMGMSVMQDRIQDLVGEKWEKKITNYYYDYEKKEVINGFPEPEGDTNTFEREDWIAYFARVTLFLKKTVPAFKERIEKAAIKEDVFSQGGNEDDLIPDAPPGDEDELPF